MSMPQLLFLVTLLAFSAETRAEAGPGLLLAYDDVSNDLIPMKGDNDVGGDFLDFDPCYSLSKKKRSPQMCLPDFVNAAFERRAFVNGAKEARDHGVELITDLHNPDNETCAHLVRTTDNNEDNELSLTVSLRKKFELTYVSLHLCRSTPTPVGVAILKSMDHGRSWQPLHFYSDNCLKHFERPDTKVVITRANEQEALCQPMPRDESGESSARLAFSTLAERPSAEEFEHSPVLQDWVTATDVKIVFKTAPEAHTEDDAKTSQLVGVADLAIGGRCKCNGHASECKAGLDGEMRCLCKHNTDGPECEKCKEFHFDRPWGRATSSEAHACGSCHCNNHARRCRFNMELYQLSGAISGGVCLRCRHNTAGRHCHYCKEGYYRNAKRPMDHKKACAACNCHPVGSSGKICNQTSGQCPCKDGVVGIECNRCARGYQQSGSQIAPCIKVPRATKALGRPRGVYEGPRGYPDNDPDHHDDPRQDDRAEEERAHYTRYYASGRGRGGGGGGGGASEAEVNMADECSRCESGTRRIRMNKYCAMNSVYLVHVVDEWEAYDAQWSRYRVEIEKRYKYRRGSAERRKRRGQMSWLWVQTRLLRCQCPVIKAHHSYLILSGEHDEGEDDEHDDEYNDRVRSRRRRRGRDARMRANDFVLDDNTMMIEWKRQWRRRMKRFKKRAAKYCHNDHNDM